MATSRKKKLVRKPARSKPAAAARRRKGSAKSKAARKTSARTRPRPAKAKARPARRPPVRRQPARDPIRELAQRIIDVTLSNDDEATLSLYAPDIESVEMGQPPMHGIDAIRQKFAGWRNMVSEAHFSPGRVCIDGNSIVIEWIGDVVLAGSGKKATLHEIALHEIRDGKIAREAFFYNPAALAPE
jgi:ketosteroid isomerase-like protein